MMIGPASGFQFVFRPTLRCNLNCRYCYAAAPRQQSVIGMTMSIKEAKTAIDWMVQFCICHNIFHASILWHGGEPLLPGFDFLDTTLKYAEQQFQATHITLINQIQTNLLLLDDRMLGLIKHYFNSQLGFSYDWATDLRVYPDGSDASNDIWRKALWCKRNGIRIGAICQITKQNRDNPEGIYQHFACSGIPFRLTPIFPCSIADTLQSAKTACRVIDYWLDDPTPPIEIGNFSEMIEGLLTGKINKCYAEHNCGRVLLTISPGGRIHPCSRTVSENDIIGNYYHDSPEYVFQHRLNFFKILEDRKCMSCAFRNLCAGGCPFHRLIGWHESDCIYNHLIFTHLAQRMKAAGYELP